MREASAIIHDIERTIIGYKNMMHRKSPKYLFYQLLLITALCCYQKELSLSMGDRSATNFMGLVCLVHLEGKF